jgi:hypothetical protein
MFSQIFYKSRVTAKQMFFLEQIPLYFWKNGPYVPKVKRMKFYWPLAIGHWPLAVSLGLKQERRPKGAFQRF